MITSVYSQLDRITLPREISRYDSDAGVGKLGWKTTVTPEQMLIEILYACANINTSCDEIGCTVDYAPGETQEDFDRRGEFLRQRGLEYPFPRSPGRHHVTLWRSEYNEESDEYRNNAYLSFMFQTDPDITFWEGL